MPSPLAHSAAGYLALRLLPPVESSSPGASPQGRAVRRALLVPLVVLLSLLPDLPSVIGLVVGNFGRFHNGPEHSLAVGLLVGPAVGLIAAWLGFGSFLSWAVLATVCYELHVVMDFLTWGRGVKVLWPFSDARYSPPFLLFYGLHWSQGWWSPRHLITVASEGLLLLVGWIASRVVGNRRTAKARGAEA